MSRDQVAQWFCLEKTRAEQSRQPLRLEQVRHLARRKHARERFVIGRPQECERRDQRPGAGSGHYRELRPGSPRGPAGQQTRAERTISTPTGQCQHDWLLCRDAGHN